MSSPSENRPGLSSAGHDPEYAEWLGRVQSTYEAVHYTCSHRLADPSLAGPVAVQVAAGLLARPTVFRYFGLPYSGRIARLAEARLAEASAGTLASVCQWSDLRDRLVDLPAEHRSVLLAVCVRGEDVSALGATLGCAPEIAARRRAATLAFMAELAGPGLPDDDPATNEEEE